MKKWIIGGVLFIAALTGLYFWLRPKKNTGSGSGSGGSGSGGYTPSGSGGSGTSLDAFEVNLNKVRKYAADDLGETPPVAEITTANKGWNGKQTDKLFRWEAETLKASQSNDDDIIKLKKAVETNTNANDDILSATSFANLVTAFKIFVTSKSL